MPIGFLLFCLVLLVQPIRELLLRLPWPPAVAAPVPTVHSPSRQGHAGGAAGEDSPAAGAGESDPQREVRATSRALQEGGWQLVSLPAGLRPSHAGPPAGEAITATRTVTMPSAQGCRPILPTGMPPNSRHVVMTELFPDEPPLCRRVVRQVCAGEGACEEHPVRIDVTLSWTVVYSVLGPGSP